MPTPFEFGIGRLDEGHGGEIRDMSSHRPHRSVFANFESSMADGSRGEQGQSATSKYEPRTATSDKHSTYGIGLQAAIDTAFARAFIYQFLARAFEEPAHETWRWLTNATTHGALKSAACTLANSHVTLEKSATAVAAQLSLEQFESFQSSYVTAFGHAARGDCPLNEIEYGDLKADPLFQPHRLADLAAFYRAFGLEIAEDASERPDHIGVQLEFMAVLASKEAYAREHQFDDDFCALCEDAQKKFLREHLGRWSPAFARRLARTASHETLAALARFTREFILAECGRFRLAPGSEDLLLRPVDETAESLCASCGLQTLPPGAVPLEGTAT